MTNITLSVPEEVVHEARIYAAERKTTVNALVREYLTSITTQRKRAKKAMAELREMSERSNAEVGPITWKREDLYDR